jgi:integrase
MSTTAATTTDATFPEPARRGARARAERPLWLEDYLLHLRSQGLSVRTYRLRRNVVEAFLDDHPAFVGLTEAHVEQWFDRLGITPATRSTYRTHLRSLFAWAHQVGMEPGTTLPKRGGPGTARTTTSQGSGRLLVAVANPWREPIAAWVSWLLAANRPESTIYLRESQLRRVAHDLGTRKPFEVSTDDLAEWLTAQQHWAPETTRSNLAALRSFYGWAHSTGRTSTNPAALLAQVRQPHRAARPAPEDVITAALATAGTRERLMILLASRLGLRRAEIAQLHTNDLRPGLDGWHLRILGKGRKERVLPVVGELRALLEAVPPGYVFPGDYGGHLSPQRVGNLLSRALGPGWTGHTLRHRFATVAYSADRDLYAVQALLGHSTPETTRVYVQLPTTALWDAVAAASV